ncbi:MAG: CoA-binding protein [Alphaproteobacteria bacterium]|nr:CoA-binding protein [Alphaproteobacteria bacterium]
MQQLNYDPDFIPQILREVKTIALVGASNNPARPSHEVMNFMLQHGYHVIPINPGLAGNIVLGQTVVASLVDVVEPIDMVDIFRNSDAAGAVVDEALLLSPLPKVIWMQIGVQNDEAAARAEKEGLRVVMDRCPKIELANMQHI